MTIEHLYILLNEEQYFKKPAYNATMQDYTGKTYSVGRSENLKNNEIDHSSRIEDINQIQPRLDDLFRKYSFHFQNTAQLNSQLAINDSTILFRGHKTVDPFIKDVDTKTQDDKVYWAKQPLNAISFLLMSNTGGTRGRSYSTPLHQIYGNKIGYLTIAKAKNNIQWYKDFGVERAQQGMKDQTMNANTGYRRAETALSKNEIASYKTFIIKVSDSDTGSRDYDPFVSMLNIKKLQQIDSQLFNYLNSQKL